MASRMDGSASPTQPQIPLMSLLPEEGEGLRTAEAVGLELDELLVGAKAPRFLVVHAVQPVGLRGLGRVQVQALVGRRPLGRHAARVADHPPQLAGPDELAVARAGGGRDALVDQGAAEVVGARAETVLA